MTNFKAVLHVGQTEIDYMVFESKNISEATKYADKRFQKAYPKQFNNDDARLHIEEVTK